MRAALPSPDQLSSAEIKIRAVILIRGGRYYWLIPHHTTLQRTRGEKKEEENIPFCFVLDSWAPPICRAGCWACHVRPRRRRTRRCSNRRRRPSCSSRRPWGWTRRRGPRRGCGARPPAGSRTPPRPPAAAPRRRGASGTPSGSRTSASRGPRTRRGGPWAAAEGSPTAGRPWRKASASGTSWPCSRRHCRRRRRRWASLAPCPWGWPRACATSSASAACARSRWSCSTSWRRTAPSAICAASLCWGRSWGNFLVVLRRSRRSLFWWCGGALPRPSRGF